MTTEQLYRLQYFLWLEVRHLTRDNNQQLHRLADCFHNLPLQLHKLHVGELTTEQIDSELQARLKEFGLEDWYQSKSAYLKRSEET